MSNPAEQAESEERRKYFRVDDELRLTLRRIEADELEQQVQQFNHTIANDFLVSSLAAISAEMSAAMHRIEGQSPDVAAYLRALDRKVDVIAHSLASKDQSLSDLPPVQPVNLSAGGISMLVDEDYPAGAAVEIKMLLFPSFVGVMTYGTVVGCSLLPEPDKATGHTHSIRVEFTHMREADRDALVKHVLYCQGAQLRDRSAET